VIVDKNKPVQGASGKETGEQMRYHTCIATPKEIMLYQIACSECGLKTETNSDHWTPAEKTFTCQRCGTTCQVAAHARAKGGFWG